MVAMSSHLPIRSGGRRRRVLGALLSAMLPVTLLLGAIGAPPVAAATPKALIDASTVSGSPSMEEQAAIAAGFDVTVVADATWATYTAADFGQYDLLIAGDPTCGGVPPGLVSSASVWGPVVLGTAGGRTQAGNRIVIGTDPRYHLYQGGATLITEGIAFAGKQPGRTGMYLDLSCVGSGYATDALTLVNAVSSSAASGSWTVDGYPPCGGSVSLIATVPGSFPTLTTASLQGWSCSVHESFPTFTSDFAALAVATDTATAPTCGIDPGTGLSACGEAYILVSGSGIIVASGSISLTPLDATNPTGTDHTVTAHVTDTNGVLVGQVVDFSVTGVNAGATGTCVPASCASDASGDVSFTYHDSNGVGDDTIKASFTDAAGSLQAATAQKHWVGVVNTPPTADAGGPYSGDEGSAIAIGGTASDTDVSDTVTTAWTYALTSADAGATCSFADATALSTTVTCTDDGTFTLTLSADDGTNPPVTSDATLTVDNVDPVVSISAPTSGALYAMGATVNLTAPFSDAGTNDTHTCTVDWADGNGPQAGSVSETLGSGTCSGSLAYAAAGIYNIDVAVTDDNGGVGTAMVQVIVYDPGAGFVTGGGWINSPAGAYTADTSLTGKANFGFVSKYKKGASVPDGNTEFQFQAGGLNFHSTSYQWLVVNQHGTNAQFKGTGTINGAGAYDFMIWAGDGSPDTFRIQITDPSNGDAVVYDNGVQQALGGGSIVIHTK